MVNIAILVFLISSFFSNAGSPLPVSVQEDVSFTLYAIYSTRDSTNSFETLIHHFEANISDDVRNMSYDDIDESKLWASKAEDYLNNTDRYVPRPNQSQGQKPPDHLYRPH